MSGNIFDGFLILSDLDGTLVSDNVNIPKRNIDAINRFKSMGGKFSVATGRNAVSVKRYHDIIGFNAPAVILNGGAVFDCENKNFISEIFIDKKKAKNYAEMILHKFPEVGIEVYVNGPINIIKNNKFIEHHVSIEKNDYNFCEFNDISKPWYKVFFAIESEILNNVKDYAESISGEEVRIVTSWANYLEMLPVSSNKGQAFINVMDYLKIDKSKACAIGDYYNDLELLNKAGICAVPSNAPDDIKKIADIVVCDCKLGAVADFIDYLEKKIEKA